MMLSKVCITRHFVRTGCCIKEIHLVAYYDSELLHGVRSKCETNKIMALSGIECPQMHWDGDNIKEKLASLQTARGAHVLWPASVTPRSREMQLPPYLGR